MNSIYSPDSSQVGGEDKPLAMADYLYLFAPISLLVINPICFG
eukprot:SAG31_NODE_26153_length_447_cov_1.321839_2_plen_42_part_01